MGRPERLGWCRDHEARFYLEAEPQGPSEAYHRRCTEPQAQGLCRSDGRLARQRLGYRQDDRRSLYEAARGEVRFGQGPQQRESRRASGCRVCCC